MPVTSCLSVRNEQKDAFIIWLKSREPERYIHLAWLDGWDAAMRSHEIANLREEVKWLRERESE